jgi:transcriptional regulator GlxA family with amidase domain
MGLLENTLPLHQFYRTLPPIRLPLNTCAVSQAAYGTTQLLNQSGIKDSGPDDRGKRYCQLAVDYLQYNLHRKIRLVEVASHLGISVRHLNRLFKTHIKTTCNEWLVEERMQKARTLMLATPTLPIKTIAYQCGFAKPAYFSKVYKDHWGSPPSQSR